MPRSPLTESIQKVRRLVTEIQGTLTVDEFNLLLDELVPEPEPEVKRAKTRKKLSTSKSSQSSSKSSRASGMAAQLKERRQEQQETMKGNNDLCQYEYDNSGVPCCFPADANVHHLTSDPNYHPFVSTAPPAPVSSPANGGVTNGTANSETGKVDASAVHHAGG